MIISNIIFPNEIIDALKNNKLVIFAGAGVSMGKPTNLPSFKELTRKINNTSSIKKALKNKEFDVVLGELKDEGVDVNKRAAEILSSLNLKPNNLHKFIIELFSNQSVKIVTTNYDQMFEKALGNSSKVKIFNAPALPLGNDVSGIVHIHGNIDEPKYMVLTDEDFGKAYLSEGYVPTFLKELFSNYTVLFIGYSHNDTIMRYLSRAMVRTSTITRYALTDNDNIKWKNLGIRSIKYNSDNDHKELYDGVKGLGEIVNRKEKEWKELFETFSEEPPVDISAESEIEYCLNDINKVKLLSQIIKGFSWFRWLEKRGVFESIYIQKQELSEIDLIWMNWCVRKASSDKIDIIDYLLSKSNVLNMKFVFEVFRSEVNEKTEKILLKHITLLWEDNDFSNKLTGYIASEIIKKCVAIQEITSAVKVFSYLFKNKMITQNVSGKEDTFSCEYDVLWYTDYHILTLCWYSIKAKAIEYDPKEIYFLAKNTLVNLFEKYKNLGLSENNIELYKYRFLSLDNEKQKMEGENHAYILLDMIISVFIKLDNDCAIDVINEFTELYESEWSFIRRIGLIVLRKSRQISYDKKVEMLLEKVDFYASAEKEQIFGLVANVFDNVNYKKQKEILDKIDTKEQKEYSRYNWYVWLHDKCKRNLIVEENIKYYEDKFDYKPRKHPELNVFWGETQSIKDLSKLSEKEILQLDDENLVKYIEKTEEDEEETGYSRRGLLKELSKAFTKNPDWSLEKTRVLIEKINLKSDAWTYIFEGIQNSEYSGEVLWKLFVLFKENEYTRKYSVETSRILGKIVDCKDSRLLEKIEKELFHANEELIKSDDNTAYKKYDADIQALNTATGVCTYNLIRLFAKQDNEKIIERYYLFFEYLVTEKINNVSAAWFNFGIQFSFFYNRNTEWAYNRIYPKFLSNDKTIMNSIWEGYFYNARLSRYGKQTRIRSMYLKTLSRLNDFSEKNRAKFIYSFAELITKYVKNPTGKYIKRFFENATSNDAEKLAIGIKRSVKSLSDSDKNKVWNTWLKKYLENRANNIPHEFYDEEIEDICSLIFALDTVSSIEFADIITRIQKAPHGSSLFIYNIINNQWFLNHKYETKVIFRWILDKNKELDGFTMSEIHRVIKQIRDKNDVICDEIDELLIGRGYLIEK